MPESCQPVRSSAVATYERIYSYSLWLYSLPSPTPIHMSCAESGVCISISGMFIHRSVLLERACWREDSCTGDCVSLCLLLTQGTDAHPALMFPVLSDPSRGLSA